MNKQEAINILAGLYRIPVENGADEFASEINKAIDMAIEALQDDWIPVSERLPEGDDDVLVTVWWGYGKPEVWAIDYAGVTRGAEEGQIADEKILAHILAWQPLPESYRPEGEDK